MAIKTRTVTECDFSDIFHYAEKKFGIGWNPCNDMFFGYSLEYKSYNEYDLEDLLDNIIDQSYEELSFTDKGYYIIHQFMIDNNLKSIRIDNR